ncbi:MAG: Eco57I restriction-modification methylase domain-containing protein, partial [Candidatus Altiarchaeota archaeon]|nr:Eco57I restriction-modification methylase domain-containing protein [Candidatus Altiarchaeota archaeon]
PKKKANRGHAKNLLARLAQDKVAFGKDYQETISLEAMYKTDKELLTVDEIAAFREKEEKEKAKSIDSTPKKEDNEDDKKKEAPDGRLPADSKSTPGEDKPESGESPEGSKKDGELSGRDHESDTGGGRNDLQSDEEGRPSGRPDKEGGDSEHAEDAGAGSSDESNERVSKQSGRVTNYHITDADQVGEGGWKQKAKDNVAAIRALKTILKENRPATLAEQALLVKYVGWGASDLANNIFPQKEYSYEKHQSEDVYRTGWKALGEELKSLLSEEEYSQAKRSTLNAHYTSPEVIKAMYAALESFGFKGGRMLEPGCGIGHFVGLMPAGMRGDTKFTGVELDGTSAAIAKLLYPEESIHQADFIKFNRPDGFYDAVIGNPPFSSTAITQDKRYEKYKFPLHDYFFAKGMDKLRPGGLMMLVTSRYTMDKEGDRLRKYLSKQADLLGAIRLPQTAFKQNAGTDVVTDVIFLRKRMEGEAPAGESWAGIKEVKTRDGKTSVNEYFATHPQMVLGTHRLTGSMYGGSSYTVTPPQGTTIGAAFEKATENLPKGIYQKEKVLSVADEPTIEYDLAPDHIKEDAYYVDDKDALLIKVDGVGKPLGGKVGQKIIRSFVKVRDAVRMVLYIQSKEDVNEKDLAKAQKELSAAYDAFVKAHGHINKRTVVTMKNGDESVRYPNISPFRNDPDAYLVASIEKYNDETGEVKKTDIFTKRVIRPDIEPKIETVEDALNVSLVNKGYVDIEDIASLAGMTKDAAIDSLRGAIFRNPNKQKWETADAYLSGNVREKLTDARLAAEEDETYKPNVEALEEVQPADLSPSQMTVTLGMPIVKPEYIVSFANEVLTLNGLRSRFIAQTGTWVLTNEYGGSLAGYRGVAATSEWGTGDRTSAELLESALNNRQVTVTRRDSDGKTYTDKVATVAANEKMQKIKKAFLKWVWESPDRAEDIAKDYNERYNNSINRSFDGPYIDRMTFPGMSSLITPYRHQKRVAWRIVQQGNTYMAHSVGAGKTIASIMAAMEMKRLGIKKKPAWVVPNHMLKQFSSEFLQLYPAAKLLVADEENFSKVQRNRFMGRVAAENWDGVIITHSAFGKMQVQPQFMADSIREMLDELEMVLDTVDHSERATRKQIERQKEKLEARLTKLAEGEGKDRGVSFEETGIDMIIVDEAQEFRKLDFITNQSTIKGIDPNGSLRAWDLYIKGKYLESLTPGRSMVLMSGTPVTNTLGEVYTIQRYLTEDLLRKNHLDNFDSWASTFGDLVTNVEAGPGGYKAVTRFAEFTNMEVLGKMWGDIGDYIRVKDLPYITLPEVDTGGRKVVAVDQTATQKRYKEVLKERVRHIENRTGRPQRGDDIILSVITDGRHAAIDERYIDPSLPPNPESKLEVMIDNVHEIWERTKADKSTQMIFSDLGVPGSEGRRGFSAYNRIKERLIELGVPANEIAFMQDYKKSQAKQDLFKRMKTGQVRVLIGSSQAMGTGVNAQD